MAMILIAVFGTDETKGLGAILKGIFDGIGAKVTP